MKQLLKDLEHARRDASELKFVRGGWFFYFRIFERHC